MTLAMPHEDGWRGSALSTSPAFNDYACTWGEVARAEARDPYHTGADEELVIAMLAWREIAGKPRRNPRGELMVSHFGFIEDAAPNAFADVQDGVHFAGLHRGLVDIFNYLGNEIYVRRRLLDVTGAAVFAAPDEPLELIPSAGTLQARRDSYPEDVETVADDNILAARYFRHFAVMFGLFHEFHHCIFGHCAYAQATLGLGRLNEVGRIQAPEATQSFHREVEFVADLGAIDLMSWYVGRGSLLPRLYSAKLPGKTQHRILMAVLSVVCAVWRRLDAVGGEDPTHPNPQQRYLALAASYLGRLPRPLGLRFIPPVGLLRHVAIDAGVLAAHCPDLSAVQGEVLKLNTAAGRQAAWGDPFKLTNAVLRTYEYADAQR